MKYLGIVLILGAVVAGGVLLSDTVPGYFQSRRMRTAAQERAEVALARAKTAVEANDPDAQSLVDAAERETKWLPDFHDHVALRRNESLIVGGSMIVVIAIGVLLIRAARRRSAS